MCLSSEPACSRRSGQLTRPQGRAERQLWAGGRAGGRGGAHSGRRCVSLEVTCPDPFLSATRAILSLAEVFLFTSNYLMGQEAPVPRQLWWLRLC